MDLKQTDEASAAWVNEFRSRAHEMRIPISATLELTSRCNLRCQHCYLGNQEEQHARREEERSTEAVKTSLKEWADAGCLYLLITGGDPMMREDFAEIYRTACELGLLVTVFCDGILVDEAMVELFREFPPRKVEISIYGSSVETYELITQTPRSYEAAWDGIHRLLASGVPVGLKTVLMTLNEHELDEMEAQAQALGVPFRYDAAVFPCLPDHSNEPLDLRVSPEVVVKHDLSNPKRRQQWVDKLMQTDALPEDDRLYGCGAGVTGFYADPFGNLSPCLMTPQYQLNSEGRSFESVWNEDLGEIREKKKTGASSCLTGVLKGACVHCPAMNFLETGDEEVESDYMKKTTQLRYRRIMELKEEM
jgi:MoaA/NifB/PqqE/SkfB family radical SAM enzyme